MQEDSLIITYCRLFVNDANKECAKLPQQ